MMLQQVISKVAMVNWLRQQPPEESYKYADPGQCVIAQFLRQAYGVTVLVGSTEYCFGGIEAWGSGMPLPQGWHDAAIGSPHTFGAALERSLTL